MLVNNLRSAEFVLFCCLWSAPLFATGVLDPDRVSWEIGGDDGNEYSLEVTAQVKEQKKVVWQSQYSTMLNLEQPLTFRLKANDETLVWVLTFNKKGNRYRLHYEIEAIFKRDYMPLYTKRRGSVALILGRVVYVSPWSGGAKPSSRLRKAATGETKVPPVTPNRCLKAKTLQPWNFCGKDVEAVLGFRLDRSPSE